MTSFLRLVVINCTQALKANLLRMVGPKLFCLNWKMLYSSQMVFYFNVDEHNWSFLESLVSINLVLWGSSEVKNI